MLRSIVLLAVATVWHAVPASAHAGGHGHLSLGGLIRHYAEPDHLAMLGLVVLGLAVLVGCASRARGWRAERRAVQRTRRGRSQ